MNTVLKQYLQEIKMLLPCDEKQKKRCIAELEVDISSYLESNPDATLDDLYAVFGTPQSTAESFLECVDLGQLSHKISAKRKIAIWVIAILAALAIALGFIAYVFADDLQSYFEGFYVDQVDVDEYSTLPLDTGSSPIPIAKY